MRSPTAPGIVSHNATRARGSQSPSSSTGGSSNRYQYTRSDVEGSHWSQGAWPSAGRDSTRSQNDAGANPVTPSGRGSRNDGHWSGGGTSGHVTSVNSNPWRADAEDGHRGVPAALSDRSDRGGGLGHGPAPTQHGDVDVHGTGRHLSGEHRRHRAQAARRGAPSSCRHGPERQRGDDPTMGQQRRVPLVTHHCAVPTPAVGVWLHRGLSTERCRAHEPEDRIERPSPGAPAWPRPVP